MAKNMAMASAMMNAASIRPTSRNMRACSMGTSSGWRAADSRNLEPMMPMPIQAPSAPRPIIRPAAMAVKLWTLARNSIMVESPGNTVVEVKGWEAWSVVLVGHRQVDDGQHHEDEGLQQDDQDVEHRPHPVEGDAEGEGGPAGGEARDQHEDQLAAVHVAEQSHGQRHG